MRDFLPTFIIITEVLFLNLLCTATVRARRETLKVRINATGDTIVLKFMQPHTDMKLKGYILGYGSSMFSKQYIQLPENGEPYETEIDAEPKYLIAVKSARPNEVKKPCPEKLNLEKPLHLVIGSVTPTSVLLSWGTLLKTPYTDTNLDDCLEESHFTVRYREEEPNKHWNYQTCPGTSTIIDNLKPDTPYEFGVRADIDDSRGVWSPPVKHNTADVAIHELLQPKNLLKPREPIVTTPQILSVQDNITQSNLKTPLLKLTEPPPVLSTTVSSTSTGTRSDDIASSPSEDPLLWTQTTSFIHTPTSQSPSKTTNTFQPQQSTISPLTTTTQQQQQHTTQYTTSTTETQPRSISTRVTTMEPLSGRTESQPRPAKTTGQLKSTTTHLQTSPTQPQPYTTQQKLNTVQSQPIITKPQTKTIQPQTQPQPTQSHPTTQPTTSQYSPTQPTTSQPPPTQPTTHSLPSQPTTHASPTQSTTTHASPTQSTTTHASPTQSTTTHASPTQSTTTHASSTQSTTSQPSPTQSTTHPLPTQPKTTYALSTQPTTTYASPRQPKTTYTLSAQPTTTHASPTQPTTTQTIMTQFQSSTTHQKPETPQKPIAKPRTTQDKPVIETRTTNDKPVTKPRTTQHKPVIETRTTNDKPVTKPKTTQHMPVTKSRTTPAPSASQTRKTHKKHCTSQPKTSTTQKQTTTHPNLIKDRAISIPPELWPVKKTPRKIQQPTTSQENLYITTSKLIHHKSMVSQHPTSQHSFYYSSPGPVGYSDHFTAITTETVKETEKPGQTSTKSQYQTVPAPNHQPTTSTIHYYSITQQQYDYRTTTTSYIKPQVSSNDPNSIENHVHVFNSSKMLTQTAKSNVNENSPRAETQADTVNKKVPGSEAGQSILHNSTSPPPVISSVRPRGRQKGGLWRRFPPPKTMRGNPLFKNKSLDRMNGHSGEKHKGMLQTKPSKQPRKNNGPAANLRPRPPTKKRPNQVEKLIEKDQTVPDLKQVESLPILKPHAAPVTEKTVYLKPTPTPFFALNGSRIGSEDNSSMFSSVPVSNVDATGKKRYVAPHVLYKTDKRPEEPCSVTDSLSYFPDEEAMNINVTGPPRFAPSNLTVVTVEGCPSFVILDWKKTDNETTEYEVTSSTKGPKGKEVSFLTTNQTHTAVENLKPESSYEFTVTPKNELGSGPSSDPVKFSTESVDPRVSDIPTGKTAIWSSFPFKADSYSECNGRMFVKRTWYRKYVGIQLCNSLRYKIYLSDSLKGKFYNIGDQTGNGEDHCQFVDSFLDGRTGGPLAQNQLPPKDGFFRAVRQEPVQFGQIGGSTHINYVAWYECGVPIPGSW